MVPVQPHHLVLQLAGKVIRGEEFTEEERTALRDFKDSYPALRNPVHVRCETHPTWGTVVLHDEAPESDSNMFVRDGQWICRACGHGENVKADEVQVIEAVWSRDDR